MKKIENTMQLQAEIKRLKCIVNTQQHKLKNDLQEIRVELKPENILLDSISSLTGIKISNAQFIKDRIAETLTVLVQRYMLKAEKGIENKVYDYVDTFFDKVKNYLSKHTSQEAKREERNEHHETF